MNGYGIDKLEYVMNNTLQWKVERKRKPGMIPLPLGKRITAVVLKKTGKMEL